MTSGVVCIDANFVVRLATRGTLEPEYMELWTQWQESGVIVVAPTLLYYEINNAIHRSRVAGPLLPEEAEQALNYALSLEIGLYGDAELHRRALALAREFALPAAYDAHYLALAERFEAELWTADRRRDRG